MSHPVRGAWIEMPINCFQLRLTTRSHPVRGAWIEMSNFLKSTIFPWSHPVRGAWIEIYIIAYPIIIGKVAPREGCVD